MAQKYTGNGKIRGRPVKGSKDEVQVMPPASRSRMQTIDVIEAVLSKKHKHYKYAVDAAQSGEEFERKTAALARKRQRDRKKLGL